MKKNSLLYPVLSKFILQKFSHSLVVNHIQKHIYGIENQPSGAASNSLITIYREMVFVIADRSYNNCKYYFIYLLNNHFTVEVQKQD